GPSVRASDMTEQKNTLAVDGLRIARDEQGVYTLHMDAGDGGRLLDLALAQALTRLLKQLAEEPDLKVLVIESRDDAFLQGQRHEVDGAMTCGLFAALLAFPAPVVAATVGGARGAGFLFAALCDFMVCNQQALYGYTDVAAGLFPSA